MHTFYLVPCIASSYCLPKFIQDIYVQLSIFNSMHMLRSIDILFIIHLFDSYIYLYTYSMQNIFSFYQLQHIYVNFKHTRTC